jgi:hypothetical protein
VKAEGVQAERHTNRGVDAVDTGFERPDRQHAKYGLDLTHEPSRTSLCGPVAQLARYDDACEHLDLTHVGDALSHPSLRLSHEMREDVCAEQVQSRHVRALPALRRAVESAEIAAPCSGGVLMSGTSAL